GTHEVESTVLFIDVWCLYPDWFLRDIDAPVDNNLIRSRNYPIVFEDILPNFNYTVPAVQLLSFVRCIVVNHIVFTVIVKEKGRVNSAECQFDGVTPTLRWVCRFNHDVPKTAGKLRGDHVKHVVMRIIENVWRINTHTHARILHLQLRGAIQHVANLRPIHEVV